MASKICRTISGASPSDGSSSISRRGRLISARPIASICCSPPDSVPPRCAMRSLSRGNSAQHAFQPGRAIGLAAVGGVGAHLQVFHHGHAREDPPALGRLRDAQPRDLVRRHVGDVAAVEQDLARAGARPAEDRHHQRRLAGAVGADQRDDLAGVDVEIDALQRLDLAVGGAQRRGSRAGAMQRSRPDLRLDGGRLPRPRRRDRRRSPWDRRGSAAACRRRSSRRSRAPRRGRRSPSPRTCRARSAGSRCPGRRGSRAAVRSARRSRAGSGRRPARRGRAARARCTSRARSRAGAGRHRADCRRRRRRGRSARCGRASVRARSIARFSALRHDRCADQAEKGEAGRPHQRVVLRDHQVFQHGHAGEQPDVLEGARDLGLFRRSGNRSAVRAGWRGRHRA